jgi:hypothetical protein
MESVINALRAFERWNAVNKMGGRRKGKRPLVSLAEIGHGALASVSRCIFVLKLTSFSVYMHFGRKALFRYAQLQVYSGFFT